MPLKTIADPAAKAELLTRLDKLTPSSTRRWGKMTVEQMICHLDDGMQLFMGKRPAKDVSNIFSRTLIRYLVIHTTMPWPHGANGPNEILQEGGGTPPAQLAVDLARLKTTLEEFGKTHQFAPHPMFGPLTDWEVRRLVYAHFDHHLRQFSS